MSAGTEIKLVRQDGVLTDSEMDTLRTLLFRLIDGFTQKDGKRWRNLLGWFKRAEPGEMMTWWTHRQRSGPMHRRHMLIEQTVFEAQERIEDFTAFRVWVKIAIGFVDWYAGAKGGVVPVPKSISYADMGQQQFDEFHESMISFFRGPHCAQFLWPHLDGNQADETMNTILEEFNE